MNIAMNLSVYQKYLGEQWALIALGALLAVLLLRHLFLSSLFKILKSLGKESYREIIKGYGKRDFLGWACLALSIGIFELSISFPQYWIPGFSRREGIFLSLIFLLLGILLHARALHVSSASVMTNRSEIDSAL